MASFPAVMVAAAGVSVTTGASSAGVAIPNAADGNRARFVMVTAKATAYIKFGASGVAATASDILVGPGQPVVFAVKPFTHVAHLQETSATLVNIVPVEFWAMTTRLVEATPDGISEALVFHGDGSIALRRSQDVEPALEANKRLRGQGDGYSPSRELRRVASIPTVVQLEWIGRYGVDPLVRGNEALLRRLLNDPDWRHLRTAPGAF